MHGFGLRSDRSKACAYALARSIFGGVHWIVYGVCVCVCVEIGLGSGWKHTLCTWSRNCSSPCWRGERVAPANLPFGSV